jgi:survival-of-motor-neuron-related-splicing factor 30
MADIKALKDAVWLKKEEIKKEEQGLSDWKAQVGLAESIVMVLS